MTSPFIQSRRQMLQRFASGFGMLGLASLLAQDMSAATLTTAADATATSNPLAARLPMYAARAKRVIFLFMSGGPSHVDLWDPKPSLVKHAGQPLPFDKPKLLK